ncbi:DinB family protein [Glaciimonas soli]
MIFNHGTHHRGQLSAALTSMGYDCPEIDLIYFVRGEMAK